MTDYIVPEVTLAEADAITSDIFGDHAATEGLIKRILLILTEDREYVASLQDPWVEVSSGSVPTSGVGYRIEYPNGSAYENVVVDRSRCDQLMEKTFVRQSDMPKVIQPKSRRDRIIDEVIKARYRCNEQWHRATVEELVNVIETASKVVDGSDSQ